MPAMTGCMRLAARPGRSSRQRAGPLGSWAAQVLRPGAAQQGADRHRGGGPHRCAVRYRARHQWPEERRQVRHKLSRPRVEVLGAWLCEQHGRLSPNNQVANAIAYSLNAWDALNRFLDDGCLGLSNNAAERALRGIAVGRNNWTFAGSDAGGRRAAAICTLIETGKLNDADPQACALKLETAPTAAIPRPPPDA